MRLRVGDETSQISAAPFHISFPMPMAKCCGCFSRIRKKLISNKSFGKILDEWDHISPSPEIIRVILWEVSHHQTQIYEKRSHISFCHTPKMFEASQLRNVHQNRKLQTTNVYKHLDVSENSGTPKSSNLIGFSIINHPFWGTPIFGNTHLLLF